MKKTGKRFLIMILCLAMIVSMMPTAAMAETSGSTGTTVWGGSVAETFAGGTGTETDPYRISNGAELALLAKSVNEANTFSGKYFVLTQNIDLGNTNWTPIGNAAALFEGFFDGGEKTITNLLIESSNGNVGLFGALGDSAKVSNLTLKTANVSGKQYVGAVSGTNSGILLNCKVLSSKINGETGIGGITGETCNRVENCAVSQTEITGTGNQVGGIIGLADFKSYRYGYSVISCGIGNSSVTGAESVGGIIGHKNSGPSSAGYFGIEVQQCYNIETNVTGTNNVGGIQGRAHQYYTGDSITVKECFNTGTVSGAMYVGGIIGQGNGSMNNGSVTIDNCYNTGEISATQKYAGGICGATSKKIQYCYSIGTQSAGDGSAKSICGATGLSTLGSTYYATITSCYYLTGADANGTQLTEEQFGLQDSFSGWNFDTVWTLDEKAYPELRMIRIELPEEKKENEGDISALDFNPILFQANLLLGSSDYAMGIWNDLNEELITTRLIRELQENGFEDAVAVSEAIDFIFEAVDDAGNLIDFSFEAKDMYSAIILDMLEAYEDVETYEMLDETNSKAKDLFTLLEEAMKIECNIELSNVQNIQSLDKDEKQFMIKFVETYLKEYDEGFWTAKEASNFISDFCEGAKTVETFLKEISTYAILLNANESTKKVVYSMYDNCSSKNSELKSALEECVGIIDASTDDIANKILSKTIKVAGKEAVKYVISQKWEELKASVILENPSLGIILLGYKSGSFISNALYNTDKIKGSYLEMLAVNDVEMLADLVASKFGEEYLQLKTEEKALVFLDAIDLIYELREADCDKANDFAGEIDDALISKIYAFLGISSTEDAKEYIKIRKNNYIVSKSMRKEGWINYLPAEYYETYNAYYSKLAEQADTKKFVIACPVDIFIYDKEGILIGKVENNIPWVKESAPIGIGVLDDVKTIYFLNAEPYEIRYIGTAEGEMDISIEEYYDDIKQRTVLFYDIPLAQDIEYSQKNASGNLNDYSLQKTGGAGIIEPNMDSEKSETEYTATINFGVLTREDESSYEMSAVPDELISIEAYIPEGYIFTGWQSSCGDEIFVDSNKMVTKFRMPDQDVRIFATLKKIESSEAGNPENGYPSNCINKVITASASKGGSISPSNILTVSYGASQTFIITPDPGYEIADVLVDGKSVGPVETYTFDKITADHTISASFRLKDDKETLITDEELISAVKDLQLVARSQMSTAKGKKAVKVYWYVKDADMADLELDGYEVFRSVKRYSGFGTKPIFVTTNDKYYNTAVSKGTKYYYKVRGYKEISGQKYYTAWSTKAWRTVK